MRLIAAIISFVIAFAMIAFGIAQRTVLAPPDSVKSNLTISAPAAVTLIDSSVLRAVPGRQKIDISGSDTVFAAFGRTADVKAWMGTASYNEVAYSPETNKLTSKVVAGVDKAVPNPQGSDLWLDEFSKAKALDFTVNVPEGITVIIVSDGTKPAPGALTITWPLDNRTPWSGPLIVGGVLLGIIGIALYLWAVAHQRRIRGPQRKTPKMPKIPKQKGYKSPKAPRGGAPTGRRSTGRRAMVAVPVLLVATLLLSGCSRDLWPAFLGGSPDSTPVSTSTALAPVTKGLEAPSVTQPQLKIIVARIAALATKADADKDVDLVKTRFEGPALALRTANYGIRKADGNYAALPAIPAGDVELTLPQQTDTWPRSVFAVVQNPDDKTVPPVALTLVQASARENYKVDYAVALEAKAVLPDVAPANVGAPRLPPDSKLLLIQPSKLAVAYGDILANGTASTQAVNFDLKNDALIPLIGQDARKALIAALPARASMTFINAAGPGDPIALGSNDSGAVVSVILNETVEVKPTEAGAAVNPEGAVKSLSGLTSSLKGTDAVYGDQLLFYVPPASSKQKIRLLGFATGLVSVKELG